MSIANYTELQTAVANWIERPDDSELVTAIPDIITFCEADLNAKIRARCMRTNATVNPSQTYNYVALPSRFLEDISFANDLGQQVKRETMEDIQARRYSASAGRPVAFDITSRIEFDCVADAAYDYVMYFYQALDIATDTTNDILTKYPNVYVYGSLVAAAPFIKNDERLQTWATLYQNAIDQINSIEGRDYRTSKFDTPFTDGCGYDIYRDC